MPVSIEDKRLTPSEEMTVFGVDDKCFDNMKSTQEEILSSCCGATIYDDTDICSECHEHCGGIDSEGNEVEI